MITVAGFLGHDEDVSGPQEDGLRPGGLGRSSDEKNGRPTERDRDQWCLSVGLRVVRVTAESARHWIKQAHFCTFVPKLRFLVKLRYFSMKLTYFFHESSGSRKF